MNTKGKLYLIPSRLGENEPLEVLPITVKKVIETINEYIVENEKTARRFIQKISSGKSQSVLKFHIINKFTNEIELPAFLEACKQGKSIGILTEAGCPAVADPGANVVKLAHDIGIQVVPLVGPSSIILALMSSGLNGQNFAFNGYLPIDKKERKKEIKRLERLSFYQNQSQLFIETPYRNNTLFEDIINTMLPTSLLCIACDLTLATEYIKTQTIEDWKKNTEDFNKRPTIFIIQKTNL